MKRILCYGDSNTWGYIPSSDHERYPVDVRYPRVLASLLGKEYEVIEEGLPGRTIMSDNIIDLVGNRNGLFEFGQAVYSALPLDYIVIMLGTNDLKFSRSAKECAEALEPYIYRINMKLGGRMKCNPKIIIVAPSVVGEGLIENGVDVVKESLNFNKEYESIAKNSNCLFIDNEGLLTGSDKIHLIVESHILLAHKIYKVIKENQ